MIDGYCVDIHWGKGSLFRTNEIALVPERPTMTASIREDAYRDWLHAIPR